MSGRPWITLEDAEAAQRALGLEHDTCPVCETPHALALTVNGDGGLHAACSGEGCPENGILRTHIRERARNTQAPSQLSPLAAANEALAAGHIRVRDDELPPQVAWGKRYGTRGATFAFGLTDGRVLDGLTAAEIRTRTRFGDAVAEQLGQTIELPPKNHRGLAALLIGLAEPVADLDTPTVELLDWLQHYTDSRCRRIDFGNREVLADHISAKASFTTTSGQLYVRPDDFASYVQRHLGGNTTRHDLASRLGRLGFTSEQPSARRGERSLKARYWCAPLKLIDELTEGVPTAPSIKQKTHTTSRGDNGDTGTPYIGPGETGRPARGRTGDNGDTGALAAGGAT